MTIREIVESKAREAAESAKKDCLRVFHEWQMNPKGSNPVIYLVNGTLEVDIDKFAQSYRTALIAILTDPRIGFKEALEWQAGHNCMVDIEDTTEAEHDAKAKLDELKELEKGI